MENQFIRLYSTISKHKKIAIIAFFALLGLFAFLASRTNFEEDITKILPKGDQSDITAKALQQLNFSDKISVIFEAETQEGQELLAEAAEIFLDSIKSLDQFIEDVQGGFEDEQIDQTFDFVYENLPLFLEEEDYEDLGQKLQPDSIESAIQNAYNTLISPTGIVAGRIILNDPLGFSFIGMEKLRDMGVAGDFELKNGFLTTLDGDITLLFLTPRMSGTETEQNQIFVNELNKIRDTINSIFENDLSISYFGAPFIAVANAGQIKSDIQKTVLISFAFLMLILILFYRKIYIPLILFLPALFGGLFSLSIMFLIRDSISAISVSIGAVLLGVTIDYSLHIITHYRENTDVKTLYKNVTLPILTSSLTTAVAFLCLLFVHSEVLRDLGIFASISVLASALASLIIIPHLYNPHEEIKENVLDRIAAYSFHKNKFFFSIILVVIILSLFTFAKVTFNNDLAALNFVPEELQIAEQKLENLGNIGSKTIYLAAYGENEQEVLAKNSELYQKLAELKRDGLLKEFSSLGEMVFSEEDQLEKIARWSEFWTGERVKVTWEQINISAQSLGFNQDAFINFKNLVEEEHQPLSLEEYRAVDALFLEEFFAEKDGFITFSSIVKLEEANRDTLVQLLSNEGVIVVDRKNLNEQFLGRLRDDFVLLINLSFLAVFIILLIFFRRVELALISMIPIVLTGLVTAGAMYFLGIEFNIFSTIVTTLILGIGIDFSIYMTSGLQHEFTTGKEVLKTYRTSILLAVITTVLALGALIFAEHPALKSISLSSLIGILAAMFITFVFYPPVFSFFISNRSKKGKSPLPLGIAVNSLISFLYYGLGGIFYSVLGMIFMTIMPLKRRKKEEMYRLFISKFFISVLYSNLYLKKKVLNPFAEDFKKPAIIIANHTSFLDTLCIGLISNRFVFLVNNWVYNSPIFGKVVRLAGYYPVFQGIEGGEDILKRDVENGYSVIIFPEGTRSHTGVISRFHKGAFYLAQKYGIDIVPIYIHGHPLVLPKGDFFIYPGTQTIEIGQRIPAEDMQNADIKKLTKQTSIFFKEKFESIRFREEGPDYFKKKIQLSFLYKERDVIREANQEFETNKMHYHRANLMIGSTAKIFRIGNDLGIWDLMLYLQQPTRKITTWISILESRKIAKQNYILHSAAITYPDEIEFRGDVLLITSPCHEDEISPQLAGHSFQKIIILNSVCDYRFLFDLNYDLFEEDTNFVLLTQRKV